MWKPPGKDFFEVQPIAPNIAQWGAPSIWTTPIQNNDYQQDDEKKKQFGIALAKQSTSDLQAAFKAACEVFHDNTNAALWVANNWLNDPIVIASRDLHVESFNSTSIVLDKDQFADKVLQAAETTVQHNGVTYYTVEAKDRLGFYRLYAEIKGYIGKNETNNNFNLTHNELRIKLVKPEKIEDQKTKIIDIVPNTEISNTNDFPVKLKIVKAV